MVLEQIIGEDKF